LGLAGSTIDWQDRASEKCFVRYQGPDQKKFNALFLNHLSLEVRGTDSAQGGVEALLKMANISKLTTGLVDARDSQLHQDYTTD
jgi:hypothetical protein